MSGSGDLINFDVIESQKENIQALPTGRSAKALVAAISPLNSGNYSRCSPDDTQSVNDSIRAEYERELEAVGESDDPLDIYDRYVKWTLDAYPSAQATTKSGLLPLLERATKTFLSSSHYKNDPRYLRLWLHYIRLFSDAPRETFAFLSRHGIGEGLALFYEEFAAWLEGAGRYAQAEEVYKMGLEREARPMERLMRKFGQFQDRMEQRPGNPDGPSSPALPTVRPALAAKVDPFASARPPPENPQEESRTRGIGGGTKTRSGKPKMAIFSDADSGAMGPSPAAAPTKGWDSIGSIRERKKENLIEPRPWVGETLKAGKKTNPKQKMAIFRDPNSISNNAKAVPPENLPQNQRERVDARTGKVERVFVNLAAVYPDPENPALEMSLDELRALHRGWMDKDWSKQKKGALKEVSGNKSKHPVVSAGKANQPDKSLSAQLQNKLVIHNDRQPAKENGEAVEVFRDAKEGKPKKIKVREIKGETQTVKTKLDSPTGPKLKRKNASEPTMTFHTRAATDEIYSIFNQPLKAELQAAEHPDSICGSDYEDDDYTSAGESTATGRISAINSEFGDDETSAFERTQDINGESEFDDQTKTGVSEWTEFSPAEHISQFHSEHREGIQGSGSETNISSSSQGHFQDPAHFLPADENENAMYSSSSDRLKEHRFVPIQPEDYNPPTGPYRDPYTVAQNRLPFMTPILEQTESSLASTIFREKLSTKTPSKMGKPFCPSATPAIPEVDGSELLGSPFQDYTQANDAVLKYTREIISPSKIGIPFQPPAPKFPVFKGNGHVIITEHQCNPMERAIQEKILRSVRPALHTYEGYYDHKIEVGGNAPEIKRYFKSLVKGSKGNGGDKSPAVPPVLCFSGAVRSYAIKRELGEGGFAPVYLAESVDSPDTFSDSDDENDGYELSPCTPSPKGKELKTIRNSDRGSLEAVKVETEPPSAWEFYMLRTAHTRLSSTSLHRRAADSIVLVHELHHFKDETILVEDYRGQGTLIDLINVMRAECKAGAGSTDSGLDEAVSMFFAIELFRTVESLHACGIIHGDLKADNCLVRLDEAGGAPISLLDTDLNGIDYSPSGAHGWLNKGLTLIDFGRAIDMHAFIPDVQFIADWKVAAHECPEMKECRPWTYQVDLHGLAGIVYIMLFGKYMEIITVSNTENESGANSGFGSRRNYRIKESLKRYWEREIWSEVFDLCLNPTSEKWVEAERQHSGANVDPRSARSADGNRLTMPMINSMRVVREKMENWLAANAARKGLQSQLNKMETLISKKRAKRSADKD
ncbi:BUB protein kinase [Coccidioides immitis RS]|uniref:BUB protein kinase n=2 Tax=Coccidioides immitis TaxID=5501 RepID=J3KIJ3_COCIM|nr:BUB protein kinase [Coccidioides immitis RS]EAS35793.3 BUB protein kinase [Coccidioides immitis RS]KMP01079.1 mitotic spindle checkpoint component mad3 [Coccidioides immitis RMSCC 2394]